MSRARSYVYAAAPTPPASTPCYYYDDMEGYVGDYSESEGLSDGATHMVAPTPPPDVTEIYRRKTVAAPPTSVPPTTTVPTPTQQVDYHHTVYTPHEYYYDTGAPQAPVARRATTVAYRKRVPIVNERPQRYYSPDSGELYESVAFRSTHQMIPTVARNLPPRVPSATAVRQTPVRRHPITVRTPRFYRRPGSTTLYKRPSALCLPVACQPDPAVYKRSKRSSSDQIYTPEYIYQQPQQPLQPQQTTKVTYVTEREKVKSGVVGTHKIPQQPPSTEYNDLNVTRSKLDAALQRYEQIFEKSNSADAERYPEVKIAQMLKPKVPQTIKEKQQEPEKQIQQNERQQSAEKMKLKRRNQKIDWSNARILEVEGAESDALEKILLADLKANGFATNIGDENAASKLEKRNKSPFKIQAQTEKSPRNAEGNIDVSIKDLPKSFNYQEIQSVVVKTKQHQQNQQSQQQAEIKQYNNNDDVDNIPSSKKCSRTNVGQTEAPMSDSSYSRPTSGQRSSQASSKMVQSQDLDKTSDTKSVRAGVVPRVLVDDALELHRTKSYVVNLIDHALSNHFGTNLCEKYSTKDNPIDPRVAMELLKKHSSCKVNKDICLEIAQALADSFNSTTMTCSASPTPVESKQETNTSSCSCSKEEPLYVKQLKQLRWGHLKHIQREVRRLEDLERFLDSCTSSNTFR